jgi:hypothetical protein
LTEELPVAFATIETNRNGLCEVCFLSDLDAKAALALKTEQEEIAASDRRMKQQGMAVRVSGWVHPQHGGDDYQADGYLDAFPTADPVKQVLRVHGSSHLDDYQIIIF